jgi:hypothetical protein
VPETAIERGLRDPDALKRIIEVIEMQNDNTRWQSQYDALVRGKIERLEQMTPETKTVLQQRWNELFADVERALGEDPSSTTAQALATRWLTLLKVFGGAIDPGAAKRFATAYQPARRHSMMPACGNSSAGHLRYGRNAWSVLRGALNVIDDEDVERPLD